ncbi:MAG: sigma 54-dependent Fis family transcriptional regulator [Labilithrix sp.]|nr:sigma 54-dependent Fis family transcriptional regulator [Labilithrix sp.]
MSHIVSRPGEIATLRRARFTRAAASGSTFVLHVVEGPDTGKVITLDANGPRALLGQSPVCSLRLTDPEVSRRHASLAVNADNLQLIDLGSTNGTTVNGVAIKEATLHGGEAIRVGRSVMSVRRDAPCYLDLAQSASFGRVIGESNAMRKLYPVLASLAANDKPVLIEGEAGTGKELVAEELHLASGRKDAPFVMLDAKSLPTHELGARLFGNGAEPGILEQARGGVIFINEVGNLSRDVQARLRDVMMAGTDVRIIAATRRDLDRDVASGRFGDDLFFLLAGGRVELPPLREREGDVALLARHFWSEVGGSEMGKAPSALPEDFLPRFEHYPWPGNVRELKSAVVARNTLGELGQAYRSEEAKDNGLDFLSAVIEDDLPFPSARERVVKEFERRYVERILARHGGSVTKAARASGVAHRYFQLIRARLK